MLLGMIEHLGHAERHWFQEVMLGSAGPLPWAGEPDEEEGDAFTSSRSAEDVLAFYRELIDGRTGLGQDPL